MSPNTADRDIVSMNSDTLQGIHVIMDLCWARGQEHSPGQLTRANNSDESWTLRDKIFDKLGCGQGGRGSCQQGG